MISVVVSTICYFVCSELLKRYFDSVQIPRGTTRSITVFVVSLGIAYSVAAAVDWMSGA
jgi:hypothetical protein